MGDLSRFFFLLQTFDQTPNQCFFPKIYLSALIKLPIPFSYSICKFLNDSLFFFLFVKTVGEAFVYVSFQDLSFSKAFFFSSFIFFFFLGGVIGLFYFTASIKISWIPFTCILLFLGFPTTFLLLVDILKYLHFLIFAPV
jgi:hypothetical protein